MIGSSAGSKFTFRESSSATCKCGLLVRFGKVDGTPVAVHAMPFCAEFQRLELFAYMRWLRNARDN